VLCENDHFVIEKPNKLEESSCSNKMESIYLQNESNLKSSQISTGDNAHLNNGPDSKSSAFLKMVKTELELEHFYIQDYQIVLIKIDQNTINHPVLSEW
jgi:hypothetical protein